MTATFSIKQGDKEIARISGEGLVFAKRVKPGPLFQRREDVEMVDDPKLLKIPSGDGKTSLLVLALSTTNDIRAERLSDG